MISRMTNDELVRKVREVRKLLKRPVISFRADWNNYFDKLTTEARNRNLAIKGITWVD